MTKKGFTLVEMLTVFAVLGVIFAIVYPVTSFLYIRTYLGFERGNIDFRFHRKQAHLIGIR